MNINTNTQIHRAFAEERGREKGRREREGSGREV
jgi:hypothetical protein